MEMPASVTRDPSSVEGRSGGRCLPLWVPTPSLQSQVTCLFSLFSVVFPYSRLLPMTSKIESTALSSSVSNSPTL